MSRNYWKEKRVLAINRKLDGSQDMEEKYVEEYNKIIDSHARNKKEYKRGKNMKLRDNEISLEYNELVDELAMLVIYSLEEHKAYTHEELNEEDKDTNTLYFSELGQEIFNEAVDTIQYLLYEGGVRNKDGR